MITTANLKPSTSCQVHQTTPCPLFCGRFEISHKEGGQAYRANWELQNKTEITHVFTYNFPQDAEIAFVEKYEAYRKELEIEGSLN